MELATVPDDTAGAVRALAPYDWHSDEARATYDSIRQMLQREVLDAQFAGLKQALDDPDPAAMQAVKDMLADLNGLLAAHARGEDTEDRFREFMDKHGDLFPENPENVDELIDALARRQAAADRMLASLSPEQRAQLGQLMSDALQDPDLASQMAQLSDNLRALRPGLERGPVNMREGGESLGYSDAVEAVAELADLEALEQSMSQSYAGSTLDDVDVETLEKHLGAGAAADFEALRQLERELERQGFVTRGDDGLRMTPRAVRRLGESALKRVFSQIEAAGAGDHQDHRTGSADELVGTTRPWVFGDELPIDAVRTGLERAAPRRRHPGPAAGRGLRGGRDRATDDGRGRGVRGPVVLDGDRGPLGPDEADRARAVAPRGDAVPAGRAADHRLRPDRPAAHARCSSRTSSRSGCRARTSSTR